MARQGGIKGWERKENYNGEKVYYQKYVPEDEIRDPRHRKQKTVEGLIIRGNEDEGYVVIMERKDMRGWEEGNPSPVKDSLEEAENEAKQVMKDINEDRLFENNTTVDEVMNIIADIASDKANDQYRQYDHIDAPKEIEKLAKFADKIKRRSNSRIP